MKFLMLAAPILLLITSCNSNGDKRINGNGNKSSEQRSFSGFTGVKTSGPYDVVLTQGEEFKVQVTGDKNLLEYVEIEKQNGTLEISVQDGYRLKPRAGLEVHVTAPALENIKVEGSGNVRSATKLKVEDLRIGISGSGDVELTNVDAPRITSSIAGSGEVILKGTTENFTASISGSGDVHAFELLSENTVVKIAGSGGAEVFASKQLKVRTVGSGEVEYKGSPVVSHSNAGSGSVRKSL